MIEIFTSRGYRPIFLGEFSSEEDIQPVIPLEQSLPEGTPMLIKLTFDEVPLLESLVALEAEMAKTDAGRLLQNYVYVDNNDPASVYVAYRKGIAISSIILIIILLIGLPLLLGGLAWAFLVPDSMKQMINMIIPLVVMMVMMKIMGGMFAEPKKKVEPPRKYPPYQYTYIPPVTPAPRPPVEERIATKVENIANRIDSIANSIDRISRVFKRSESEGAAKVVKVSSDISKVAKDVHHVPESEMPKPQKAYALERLTTKQRRLVDNYEEKLSPRQRQLLEEERKIVEDLRAMYD